MADSKTTMTSQSSGSSSWYDDFVSEATEAYDAIVSTVYGDDEPDTSQQPQTSSATVTSQSTHVVNVSATSSVLPTPSAQPSFTSFTSLFAGEVPSPVSAAGITASGTPAAPVIRAITPPQQSAPLAKPLTAPLAVQTASMPVYVDLSQIRVDLGDQPYEMDNVLHCKLLNPLLNDKALTGWVDNNVSNPVANIAAKYTLTAPAKLLYGLDYMYFGLFKGVSEADRAVNRDGIFPNHGFNTVVDDPAHIRPDGKAAYKDPTVKQFAQQWGVRTAEVGGTIYAGNYLYRYARNVPVTPKELVASQGWTSKGIAMAKRAIGGEAASAETAATARSFRELSLLEKHNLARTNTTKFWSPWLTIMAASSGIIKQSHEALNLIPGNQSIQGPERSYAQHGINGALALTGAAYLAYKYREVKVPDLSKRPAYAADTPWIQAGAFAISAIGMQAYTDNAAAQQRVLPKLHDMNSNWSYIPSPWTWDWDYVQSQTSGSRGVSALVGSGLWVALTPVNLWLADKAKVLTGLDKSVLELSKKELAYVQGGTSFFNRRYRGFKVTLSSLESKELAKKRKIYFAQSMIASFIPSNAANRAIMMSQGYDSVESLTGTSLRTIVTTPYSQAMTNYHLGNKGYATNVDIYTDVMVGVSPMWGYCSAAPEAIYQSTAKQVDDYKNATTVAEKERIGAMLVNNWLIANGSDEDERSEKHKIRIALAAIGIDPRTVYEEARKYQGR